MNAELHAQVYGLRRGVRGTLEDSENFAVPSFSTSSRYPLQSCHELGGRESPSGPYQLCAKTLLGLRWTPSGECPGGARRKKELTPVEQKDSSYWIKRRRNNEAARRSRQRRRTEEILLETRAVELLRENEKLKATLSAVQDRLTPAADHREVSSDRLIAKDCFHYPTRNQPLSHNYEVSKDLFCDRFAYLATRPAPPPHFDSYRTFSLNAASSVSPVAPPVNVGSFAATLRNPVAARQKNENQNRNAAPRREDAGHHDALATFHFQQQGYKLFQGMETTSHSRYPESASSSRLGSCKNGARGPGMLEQITSNSHTNQSRASSQEECCMVGSNFWENEVKDKLPAPKAQESGTPITQGPGALVSFLPHKLRFKATNNKARSDNAVSPNSVRGKDETVREISCPTSVGEVAHNTAYFLNPRQTYFPESKATRSVSYFWDSPDHTISTREETLGNTCTPQKSGPCAFSLFRQFSNNDTGEYGKRWQGIQSPLPLEHERETEKGGLRNQLASLDAEVKYLKQIVLANSTA